MREKNWNDIWHWSNTHFLCLSLSRLHSSVFDYTARRRFTPFEIQVSSSWWSLLSSLPSQFHLQTTHTRDTVEMAKRKTLSGVAFPLLFSFFFFFRRTTEIYGRSICVFVCGILAFILFFVLFYWLVIDSFGLWLMDSAAGEVWWANLLAFCFVFIVFKLW